MPVYRPTLRETAAGLVPGHLPVAARSPWSRDPRAAFEDVVLEALRRPPCVVAFSGGRDSSAVLAVAADLSRRYDLPAPLPVVYEYPGMPEAFETDWQERVLGHLGLAAVRVDGRPSADLLGVHAQDALRRHGPFFPPAAAARVPLLELARGGSLLAGEGGDEVLGPQRITSVVGTWRRRRRPDAEVVRAVAVALAPTPARAAVFRRQVEPRPWLRPPARAAALREVARDDAAAPLSWAGGVRRLRRSRAVVHGIETLEAFADEHDVLLGMPFYDQGFVDAWADRGGSRGFVSRTECMQVLFGDLLPPDVLARTSKAFFNEAVIGPRTRAFLDGWDGRGLPEDLVDTAVLQDLWRGGTPHGGTLMLLHQAWWQAEHR